MPISCHRPSGSKRIRMMSLYTTQLLVHVLVRRRIKAASHKRHMCKAQSTRPLDGMSTAKQTFIVIIWQKLPLPCVHDELSHPKDAITMSKWSGIANLGEKKTRNQRTTFESFHVSGTLNFYESAADSDMHALRCTFYRVVSCEFDAWWGAIPRPMNLHCGSSWLQP